MKYALVVLCALLVGCGGLTKEQQATAYNAAANKYDSAVDAANADYDAALDVATTDDEKLLAITDMYSTYAGIDRIFADALAEISWTSDFSVTAERLADCVNETYLLEIEVLAATELQEAIDLAKTADDNDASCDLIADELKAALGLEGATE